MDILDEVPPYGQESVCMATDKGTQWILAYWNIETK